MNAFATTETVSDPIECLDAAPVVRLGNGLRVANFSSPHPFAFEDGSVLPACTEERSRALAAFVSEVPTPRVMFPGTSAEVTWEDVDIYVTLGRTVERALDLLEMSPDVDLVIVPLMILEQARGAMLFDKYRRWEKVRTCRMKDRIKKIAHADKFCV